MNNNIPHQRIALNSSLRVDFLKFCLGMAVLSASAGAAAATPAWGMFKGGANRQSLTSLAGPVTANLRWKATFNEGTQSGAVVAGDGSVYIGSQNGYVYAYSANGALKWKYRISRNRITSVPALAPDGTLYASAESSNLYALNADGSLKWTAKLAGYGGPSASPLVANDGTIYLATDKVYAFNSDGSQRWAYKLPSAAQGPVALASDGTVYAIANNTLYALSANGSKKWAFTSRGAYGFGSAPAIASDGSIYVNTYDGVLYSLTATGNLNWTYATTGIVVDVPSSPAIGSDGTIYFGGAGEYYTTGGGDFFAITPSGRQLWSYHVGCSISAPAIGGDGTVYVANNECGGLYAFTASGALRWSYSDGTIYLRTPPAIGPNQSLYVGILPYSGTPGGLVAFGN